MPHSAEEVSSRFAVTAFEGWTTPRPLFDRLHAEFDFTLDAAASPENCLCPRFFTREEDALASVWEGRVFVNPPYGRGLGRWVAKVAEARLTAELVAALLPVRSDTAWWHDYVMLASEVRLIRGRLSYQGGPSERGHNAPFPSAVVVFTPDHRGTPRLTSAERS